MGELYRKKLLIGNRTKTLNAVFSRLFWRRWHRNVPKLKCTCSAIVLICLLNFCFRCRCLRGIIFLVVLISSSGWWLIWVEKSEKLYVYFLLATHAFNISWYIFHDYFLFHSLLSEQSDNFVIIFWMPDNIFITEVIPLREIIKASLNVFIVITELFFMKLSWTVKQLKIVLKVYKLLHLCEACFVLFLKESCVLSSVQIVSG